MRRDDSTQSDRSGPIAGAASQGVSPGLESQLSQEIELADILPRVFFLAFLIYTTIAVTQTLAAPQLWQGPLPAVNVVTALVLLAGSVAMRRVAALASYAHCILAAGAMLILANCLLRVGWTATPAPSVAFFLIGVACIVRSTAWFFFLEGTALVSLGGVTVAVLPREGWAAFLGLHAIAFANASLIYFVRAQADRRALALRERLEQQNELLEASAAAAHDAERRYQAALDNASDIIYTMDEKGHPTYLNPIAKEAFPAADWSDGFFFLSRVHPDSRHQVEAELLAQLRTRQPSLSQEFRLEEGDREDRWLEQIVRFVSEPHASSALHVVARDISERKRAEQALLMREQILAAVAEVANLMIGQREFLSALDAALPLLGKATMVSRAYAFRNSKDQGGRRFTSQIAEWSAVGIASGRGNPDYQNLPLAELGDAEIETMLSASGGIFALADDLPRPVRRLAASRGVRSVAIVPIYADSRLWGFLGFDDCVNDRRWSSGEMDTLRSAAGIIGAALGRRVTERKLRKARDAAEAATRTKSEFLANMSHEIRTPLNGILGMTELVLQCELDSQQREQITAILNSGRSLLTIINDILDISRIEAGRLEIDSLPFRPLDLVQDLMQLLRPGAAEKGLRFQANTCEPLKGLVLLGDPVRLRQILTNVLGNAVKFTDRGHVTLEVDVVSEGTEATLRFTISDSGIGIEREKQARIFEPFEQGDSSVTRRFGGTGLGLSITRSLVREMGGSIALSSEAGRGTEVSLVVPFPLASREQRRSLAAASQGVTTAGSEEESEFLATLKALVAEDDRLSRHIAAAFLKALGCGVDQVCNGLEAVQLATDKPYDVIFLDVQMPEMDGLSATRTIRAGGLNSQTPIIAMTALAMDGDRERCLEAGMTDYLSKPLDRQRLREVLSSLERASSAARPAPVQRQSS